MNFKISKLPNSTYFAVIDCEFNGYQVREHELLASKKDLITYLTALIETESPKLASRSLNYADSDPIPFTSERSEN